MIKQKPLSDEELAQFVNEGYVVARGLLDLELDIQPVMAEYEARLGEVMNGWQARGRLKETWPELPFGERLTRIVSETNLDYSQPLDISLPQSNLTEETPIHTGPAIFNLMRSPRMLNAVEQFIGPEIYSNPVQHVRIKPPESALPEGFGRNSLITHTPWHQDMGVIHDEADESNILTVWLAITEATEENGCMVVVPGSHTSLRVPLGERPFGTALFPGGKGHLALHCPIDGDSVTIPESRIQGEPKPLPMQPGDVLFMTSTTMHTSLRNLSNGIRWSFDLRYNPIGEKTGRPWFPGFVARSEENPETELHDAEQWAQMWRDARQNIIQNGIPTFNRWDGNAIGCA